MRRPWSELKFAVMIKGGAPGRREAHISERKKLKKRLTDFLK
jgi:hypothetical protein